MKKEIVIYIDDVLNSANKILEYTENLNEAHQLAENDVILDAVLRRVQVMGEAVKRIPNEYRDLHTQIPWKLIAGLRDVVVHDYDEIKVDQLWEVIKNRLPTLIQQLEDLPS